MFPIILKTKYVYIGMRKIITQHSLPDQKPIFDLTQPTNAVYATKFGFEYTVDSTIRITDNSRTAYWEKIAWLLAFLPTVDDGSLVVWEDVDSLNVGNEDFSTALPPNGVLGMVQYRHGLNRMELKDFLNSGVIVMINSPVIRTFWQNVWNHGGKDDECGIMQELNSNNWCINGTPLSTIDPKWNCWKNNMHLCSTPVVKTFHGMTYDAKVAAIKATLG